jgi:hypothetical protein
MPQIWSSFNTVQRRIFHTLQRRPQLAQQFGGLSESSAARKSRYAGAPSRSPARTAASMAKGKVVVAMLRKRRDTKR